VTSTIYVKNNGTIPVVLTMTTGTWSPATASSYVSLSWDMQDYVLAAGSSVQAVLTLSISSSVSGLTSFTFDITITGTQST
jgi:type IV secretory pathway VirB10-like protein